MQSEEGANVAGAIAVVKVTVQRTGTDVARGGGVARGAGRTKWHGH